MTTGLFLIALAALALAVGYMSVMHYLELDSTKNGRDVKFLFFDFFGYGRVRIE